MGNTRFFGFLVVILAGLLLLFWPHLPATSPDWLQWGWLGCTLVLAIAGTFLTIMSED